MVYTNKEIFNIVKERAKNPAKSEDSKRCLYRGQNGLKCFVGELIPDEVYNPGFESDSICMLWFKYEHNLNTLFTTQQIDLLEELQRIHDREDPTSWGKEIKKVEKVYS
jgi:hypothetical protein